MSRIFWDTNLFIYLFEDYGELSERVETLRTKMLKRQDHLITSTLSIGELQVMPMKAGNESLCRKYEEAIRATSIVVNFDVQAARQYAKLRAHPKRKISPPDAIQLACAASVNVDLFLTNDARLHDLQIDGIQFITSMDRAPI